jgi:GNAT superfamily N-acetyltransferase
LPLSLARKRGAHARYEPAIKITQVCTRRDWRTFINLPWKLYKDDPNWVPPLKADMWDTVNPAKNPLMKLGPYRYFLAWKNGKPVGRIGSGIDEKLNREKNKSEGYITLFESINDYEVAKALFDAALSWLRESGITTVTGPQSPSNGDDYRGLLIKGFDGPPVLMNTYNPPYYAEFFDRYGWEKQFDRLAFYYDLNKPVTARFERSVELLMKRYKYTVRPASVKKLREELLRVQKLIARSMPEEWPDMVPPSIEEVEDEAKKLLPVIDPDLAILAENDKGEPVGFALGLPDYNQVLKRLKSGRLLPIGFIKFLWYKRKISGGRMFVLMVDPDYRNKGVSAAMYLYAFRAGLKKGYTYGDGSTIHEFNIRMRREAERAGGELYRIFRIYQIDL